MGNLVGVFRATGAAMVCMLVLSGCAQSAAAPPSEETAAPLPQETTEPPVDGGKYASVVEVRDAMVKAGLPCPSWEEHPKTADWSAAECSENTLIATYPSWEKLNKQLNRYRAMGESLEMTVLVGVNWTIDSPLAYKVEDKLGGYLYKSTGKK